MDSNTLTLIIALVATIGTFGAALIANNKALMKAHGKTLANWQADQAAQHAEAKRTVDALTFAVRELREWRNVLTKAVCGMDETHDKLVAHMASLTTAMAALMELASKSHTLLVELNGKTS